MSGDDERWTHLVNAAFRLDEMAGAEPVARLQSAAEVLDSAVEVFPSSIDPMEDWEGYAVRRLLLALRNVLERPLG